MSAVLRVSHKLRYLLRGTGTNVGFTRAFYIMIRPSPACPPDYLQGLARTAVISPAEISPDMFQAEELDEDLARRPTAAAAIFGAGKVGTALVDAINAKGLAEVRHNSSLRCLQ